MKRFALAVVLLGLSGAIGGATAEDGFVNAVSYRPVSAGLSLAVRPLDNSPDNLELARRFERELAALGFAIARDAGTVLSFETRQTVASWSDSGRRTVLQLESRGDGIVGDRQRVLLNLYDSESGGLVNEGREHGTQIVTPTQLRIDATLDDRRSGERLWQGWATVDLLQGDGAGLNQAMIAPLARNLGKTVRREAFPVQ